MGENGFQTQEEIVKVYSDSRGRYADCLNYVENTIKNVIKSGSIDIHEIIGRVKTVESLSGKVSRKTYNNLTDIADLCGIRIITYFNDDVDKIASIINQEFEVDIANTIDKRKSEDPTKFGYVSLHYVISLKEDRSPKLLYDKFKDIKLEIQIRTVMQHAWAEIEHDLGYKSKEDIPDKYRRQFSILAGLIELADDNFVQLKNNIVNYEKEAKEKLANLKAELPIDRTTLETYIKEDQFYADCLSEVIQALNSIKCNTTINIPLLSSLIQRLKELGLRTIDDVDELLKKYIDVYIRTLKKRDISALKAISILTPLLTITSVLMSADSAEISDREFEELSSETYRKPLMRSDKSND